MVIQSYECVLTPAYGRTYLTEAEAVADWKAGKDFTYNRMLQQTYCSIRDFAPGAKTELRYGKHLEHVTVVEA
jgi:hypothetical protein